MVTADLDDETEGLTGGTDDTAEKDNVEISRSGNNGNQVVHNTNERLHDQNETALSAERAVDEISKQHYQIYAQVQVQDTTVVARFLVCAKLDDTVLEIAQQVEVRLEKMWKVPLRIKICERITGESVPDSTPASAIADEVLVCRLPTNETLCLACGQLIVNPTVLDCGHTIHSQCINALACDNEYVRGLICVKCPLDDRITRFSRRHARQKFESGPSRSSPQKPHRSPPRSEDSSPSLSSRREKFSDPITTLRGQRPQRSSRR